MNITQLKGSIVENALQLKLITSSSVINTLATVTMCVLYVRDLNTLEEIAKKSLDFHPSRVS